MLSRVANSIYWMARYVERAENVARFIDVNLQLMAEIPDEQKQWSPLIFASGDEEGYHKKHDEVYDQTRVINYLTFDRDNPNSIVNCLSAARENARSIREVISSEIWLLLNKSYLNLRMSNAAQRASESPTEFFNEIKSVSHMFAGLSQNTMTHGEAYQFMRLGASMERADKTSRILDVKYFILLPHVEDVGTPLDNLQWAAVLKSASAWEAFRKRYRQITPRNVAEFLVSESGFPRSMHHCLIEAEHRLHTISGSRMGSYDNRAELEIGRLRSDMDYTPIDDVLNRGLHEFIDDFQQRLNLIDTAIFETFFALRSLPQPSGRF